MAVPEKQASHPDKKVGKPVSAGVMVLPYTNLFKQRLNYMNQFDAFRWYII
ncbi:MAG: hypothetical protein ACTSP4_15715 [Candidatus Hodarchaeales archaeon]